MFIQGKSKEEEKKDEELHVKSPKNRMYFKIIRKQLNKESHPIRKIISEYKRIFIDNYQQYVDRKNLSSEELFSQLEEVNDMMAENNREISASLEERKDKEFLGNI